MIWSMVRRFAVDAFADTEKMRRVAVSTTVLLGLLPHAARAYLLLHACDDVARMLFICCSTSDW
jgi:hypothetical protein